MIRHFFSKHFLPFLFIAFVLEICSCSNNVPELGNSRLSVVFDYNSYDDLPNARLSIFVESVSNPRRFDTITVTSDQNEYVWEANDLVLAADSEKTYCGVTNFVMPANQKIPSGEYTILFRQADDEQTEIKRILSYDKSLYETKGSDVSKVMKKFYSTRMLTVYDANKKIIYYGPRTSELLDSRGIWNNYREAAEYQESWINQSGTIICNLPMEKVEPGN